MLFRISDYVQRGSLDNRQKGLVRLTLHILGLELPVTIDLQGDCLRDLAGCFMEFENPHPQRLPSEGAALPTKVRGTVGDMTASRRTPSTGNRLANALYLEWFTDHDDMVLLESLNYSMTVSLPEWEMEESEEQVQIMTNQQMFRSHVKHWAKLYANHQEDGDLPDHHWDKRLREAEGIAIAYQEVFQKYRFNPTGDIRLAFVMGWDEVLDGIAQSEENGTPCTSKSSGMLSLFDILNEEEAQEVQSCMFQPLFQQVMELTELCQRNFKREISQARLNKEEPREPFGQLFFCIRYITPRILSCLLQDKEDEADFSTMAARMAMCVDETERTTASLQEHRKLIGHEVMEGFSNLLEEITTFQISLARQSKRTNL